MPANLAPSTLSRNESIILQSGEQRMQVLPLLGGSIASWDYRLDDQWQPLFRPWDRISEDRYTMACFPLLPWSNRVTEGGFMHAGTFHPVGNNRAGEPYPIHGDGWLQSWDIIEQSNSHVVMALSSRHHQNNPYSYDATQTIRLSGQSMSILLEVTNTGENTLPHGLGLHPYFLHNAQTRLQFHADGVWLSGHDPIPTQHTNIIPDGWNYNTPAAIDGVLIDHCFTGWDGTATIDYPDTGLQLTMQMHDNSGYTLLYRPPGLDYFCLEPVTHPIDAFHMPDMPGLTMLAPSQRMQLATTFNVTLP